MVAAIANPRVNVLGHCTGRIVKAGGKRGGLRPESEFDAGLVFDACAAYDVAVEINSRPERLDPPKRLLLLAAEAGCVFSIDSDAHAPAIGQGPGAHRAFRGGPERLRTDRRPMIGRASLCRTRRVRHSGPHGRRTDEYPEPPTGNRTNW
jgi:hypothetical protein